MMIRDSVRVLVREPGSTQPVMKSFQDRIFFEYRNKGFGIYLNRDGNGAPHSAVSRPHGLAMETFSQMRAVCHQSPGLVFDIGIRHSYHIPTYQTFLGVVADPHEPFHHWTDAKNHKDFYQHLSFADREWIHAWAKETYGATAGAAGTSTMAAQLAPSRPIFSFPEFQLRVDFVAISDDCAALVTSCNDVTEQFLLNFAGHGHLTHAFLQRCQHERYKKNWGQFYQARKFSPRLYVGVGPSEFGNGDVAVDTPELVAMAQRVATNVSATTPFPGAAGRGQGANAATMSPHVRALARQLGITLLRRHEMRYFVVRD